MSAGRNRTRVKPRVVKPRAVTEPGQVRPTAEEAKRLVAALTAETFEEAAAVAGCHRNTIGTTFDRFCPYLAGLVEKDTQERSGDAPSCG